MACARPITWLALGLTLAVGGCSFGPRALERSHGQYAETVRRVEEEQFLRVLVRLRYNESSINLDITSIAAQYELSAGAEARPFFEAPNPAGSVFRTFPMVLPDLMVGASNRPTMSFAPLDDSASVRQSLTPITLDTLVFLTQTSWPVSTILKLWVDRLNGVPNAVTGIGPNRDAPLDFARFHRIAALMQAAQDQELAAVRTEENLVELSGPLPADAITPAAAVEAAKAKLEYRPRDDGKTWALIRRERRLIVQVSPGAERSPELVELATLLNLVPGQSRYDIAVAGRGSPDPARFPAAPTAEIRLIPRSTVQAFLYMAKGIEVPDEHLCHGLVQPAVDLAGHMIDAREVTRGLFEVHACQGKKPPPTAYVAIPYRGYWFYIDDRDHASKATFALMFQLSRLDFARQSIGAGPLLTLPAGR
jgi:hypothetical protein